MRVRIYTVLALAAGITTYLLGAGVPWSLAAAAVAVMAPHFLLGALRGLRTPSPREDPIADMSGTEFEDYVARIARTGGHPVMMTPVTGDWGVDLIVGKRPNRLAVQCKRRSRPVGAGAVQEVVAGAPMHDCSRTLVVTNHDFTPAARRLAEQHGCTLVGGSELRGLRSVIRGLVVDDSE